ncbi:hypothetical protein KY386_01195 [Candidatus Parcubacteria bacterium]|nr:hypothetical protein [Candidatus Parcubacteria bacterium]
MQESNEEESNESERLQSADEAFTQAEALRDIAEKKAGREGRAETTTEDYEEVNRYADEIVDAYELKDQLGPEKTALIEEVTAEYFADAGPALKAILDEAEPGDMEGARNKVRELLSANFDKVRSDRRILDAFAGQEEQLDKVCAQAIRSTLKVMDLL